MVPAMVEMDSRVVFERKNMIVRRPSGVGSKFLGVIFNNDRDSGSVFLHWRLGSKRTDR
jgi:hypothetical protein